MGPKQGHRSGGKIAQSTRVSGALGKRHGQKGGSRGKRIPHAKPEPTSGGAFVAQFLNEEGLVLPDDVARSFGMSKGQLAEIVGVRPDTLQRFSRVFSPRTQSRLKEMLEIVGRIGDWAGGKHHALAWYRAEPIPAFGGRTAESLVKDGKAGAVRDYLDRIALGGFV